MAETLREPEAENNEPQGVVDIWKMAVKELYNNDDNAIEQARIQILNDAGGNNEAYVGTLRKQIIENGFGEALENYDETLAQTNDEAAARYDQQKKESDPEVKPRS